MAEIDSTMILSKSDLPSCWDDEERMLALMAPFRLKAINPVGYEGKLNFWTQLLATWCKNLGEFKLGQAKVAFTREGRSPACLETVFQELQSSGVLVSRSSLAEARNNANLSWASWGGKQLFRPAVWAVTVVKKKISTPSIEDLSFVHLPSIKNQALKLLTTVPEDQKTNSAEELRKFMYKNVSHDLFDIVMDWLISENLATVSSDGTVFKLSINSKTKVKQITEAEMCLQKILRAIEKLEKISDDFTSKIENCRNLAKKSLAAKEKNMAMSHLRQKKSLELRLEKTSRRIDSLTAIADTLRQTHDDSQVFEVYKNGVNALKKTMKVTGLEEDHVLDTMDELKDALDTYSDIETALSQPVGITADMDELERELALLVENDNKNNGGMTNPDLNLPTIPANNIVTPVPEEENKSEIPFDDLEKRLQKLRLPMKN